MFGIHYPEAIAIAAGLCGGAVIGAFLATKPEMRLRKFKFSAPIPASATPIWDGLKFIVSSLLGFALIFAVSGFVTFCVFRVALGSHYCFTHSVNMFYGWSFLSGAGLAKYARYLYFRSQ